MGVKMMYYLYMLFCYIVEQLMVVVNKVVGCWNGLCCGFVIVVCWVLGVVIIRKLVIEMFNVSVEFVVFFDFIDGVFCFVDFQEC